MSVCRGNIEKKEALENLDLILLCIDEIIDGGYAFVFPVYFTSTFFMLTRNIFQWFLWFHFCEGLIVKKKGFQKSAMIESKYVSMRVNELVN